MSNAPISIGYLSGKMHGLIKVRVQRYLDAAGIDLKMELYPILNTLWRTGGLTQQGLSDHLGYDRHKMSRLLDVLEAGGWLQREAHPNSRREKLITLTAYSQGKKDQILICVQAALSDALEGLTPERKQEFIDDLNRVIKNLS